MTFPKSTTASAPLNLNTPEGRIKAYQQRMAAGKPERVRKSNQKPTEAPADLLYDMHKEPNVLANLFPAEVEIMGESRLAAWAQKSARQFCWLAAVDAVSAHDSGTPLKMMKDVILRSKDAANDRSLDIVETQFMGQRCTAGRLAMRKQFWKFVSYRLDHIVPKDLQHIIDVDRAVLRELGTLQEKRLQDELAAKGKPGSSHRNPVEVDPAGEFVAQINGQAKEATERKRGENTSFVTLEEGLDVEVNEAADNLVIVDIPEGGQVIGRVVQDPTRVVTKLDVPDDRILIVDGNSGVDSKAAVEMIRKMDIEAKTADGAEGFTREQYAEAEAGMPIYVKFSMLESVWNKVVTKEPGVVVVHENSTEFVVEYAGREIFAEAVARFDGLIEFEEIVNPANEVANPA